MKTGSIMKTSLIIAISIVLNLFFFYSIEILYPEKDYSKIYRSSTQTECQEIGGKWTKAQDDRHESDRHYCEKSELYKQVRAEKKEHSKNVFMILIALGTLTIALGFILSGVEIFASALPPAGLLTYTLASMEHWEYASDPLRLVILGLALVVLFFIGYKKLSKKQTDQ